ncbi:MAG: phosphoglycerate dehydrogenase [Gammaproteobacteria bacterium]|nr:phosphoglycerate dehydrogenase [Gammaproteobacteria bacterium]
MYKIFIADKLGPEGVDLLKQQSDAEVDFAPGLSEAEVIERIGRYDAVIVRSATKIKGAVLEAAKNVRVIGRAGIGVDNIDVDGATERGIVVLNTPDANATTTAELAIAHLFSVNRNLPQADSSVRGGQWRRDLLGTEITGKTIGIIGFGTIGRIVADRCRGLKMKVIGHDPFVTNETFMEHGVEPRGLDELLAESDYVTMHCPVTDSTKGMMNAERFGKMKKGAMFINCARGTLVDEAALVAAVDSGHLAGAALDVFQTEPPKDSPVLGCEKILFTPHLGASTHEAQAAVGTEIAKQVMTFLRTGEAINAVNLPRIPGDTIRKIEPYQALARKLGALLAGMITEPLKTLEVGLYGRASELKIRPIANDALIGVLSGHLSIPVNQVNANAIARRQGVTVTETCSENSRDFVSLLKLTGSSGGQTVTVEGTLFDEVRPRLVRINSYDLETALEGLYVFTRHADQPGVIGAIGACLGKLGINISSMHLGVAPGSDQALAAICVSQLLDESTLESIRNIPGISNVMQISF